jgi:hypothetical protein
MCRYIDLSSGFDYEALLGTTMKFGVVDVVVPYLEKKTRKICCTYDF